MSDRRFIKPVGGRTVRDPADGLGAPPIPAHGKRVMWNSFWERRFDQGDVEMTSEADVDAGDKAAAAALAKASAGAPAKIEKETGK